MFVHIIHLPVTTGIQPGQQPWLGVPEIDIGNTDLIEAKRLPPSLDTRSQRREITLPTGKFIVPQAHSIDDNGPTASMHLLDESATLSIGERLAKALPDRLTIHLIGDLGAGKTTLCRGLLRGLGYLGKVKSPTYTLVEPYKDSRIVVYHFDFYRFTDENEFLEAGLDEYFEGSGIRLVEWPERAQPFLPEADLEIRLQIDSGGGRTLTLLPLSPEGRKCLQNLDSS